MRRQNHIVEPEQRLRRPGLVGEDIQGRTAERARLQHLHRYNQAVEIVLSNEFPPRLPPDEIEDEIPAGPPAALIET